MSDPIKVPGITDSDNGSLPASPCKLELHGGMVASFHGLSKRELLAAMAMQGSLSGDVESCNGPEVHAAFGVKCADALLAELAKPQEGASS